MAAGQYKNKAYPLRIKGETLDAVKVIAEANNVSANKQIELILEDYIKRRSATRKVLIGLTTRPPKAKTAKIVKIQKRP